MPHTDEELLAAVESGEPPDTWRDGSPVTDGDRGDILALRRYVARLRADEATRRSKPQRRAMVLLRSLLSADQRRQLRRRKCFMATAASGRAYRFYPRSGHVEAIARHGRRWFGLYAYCIHDDRDDGDAMPPADLTVAHLLMVLADEAGFLATANARSMRDEMWNSEYLRRLRRRHREDVA